MSRAATNTLWARTFVDELARAGVRDVCLAPGSRSTALVLAAEAHPKLRLRVHLDERSAGFFALGMGKRSRRPAAVVTTSGTAAANLLPAVVEASQAEVPLLVVTADRPPRLRGADANQAIDQIRLYGVYPRAFHDLGLPEASAPSLRWLRAVVARSVADAVGVPAGPVHVNAPFEKPFEPEEPSSAGPGDGPGAAPREGSEPWTEVSPRRETLDDDALRALANRVEAATEGVVVVGPVPDPDALGPLALRFAAAAGFPLLADPLSGARWRPHHGADVVTAYDLFLADPATAEALRPDLVLRLGQAPTSTALGAWLERHAAVEQVVLDTGHRWKDHGVTAHRYLRADPAAVLPALSARARRKASSEWRDRWCRLEERTRWAARAALQEESAHEATVVVQVLERAPDDATVFVSSSMPVRDLDAFGAVREAPLRALGNRGGSGIDGIVSTALGVAAAGDEPVVALVGDLAFYHDMNGLLAAREPDAEVVFVVIHNDGGGIFHMLPVEGEPGFERLFATPHGLEFTHAAALYGLPFERASADAVGDAVVRALERGGTRILEVRSDREANRRAHEAVRRAVLAVLEADEEAGEAGSAGAGASGEDPAEDGSTTDNPSGNEEKGQA